MKNLVRSIMRAIMLVSLSVLLTLIRLVLIMVILPPFKLLEKTNSLYQESMEETSGMLSL